MEMMQSQQKIKMLDNGGDYDLGFIRSLVVLSNIDIELIRAVCH